MRQNGLKQHTYLGENGKEKDIFHDPITERNLLLNSSFLKIVDIVYSDVKEITNQGIIYEHKNPQLF